MERNSSVESGFTLFLKSLNFYIVILLLITPYLYLLFFINKITVPPWHDISSAVIQSVLQAFLSALGSLVVGFFGAFGLHWVMTQRRVQPYLSIVSFLPLLPNFIPPLVFSLSFMSLVNPFPFGMPGVIFLHIMLNLGIVSWVVEQRFRQHIAKWAEVAEVLGCSKFYFWLKVGLPLLKKDLYGVFAFVFTVCLTSFSIPLLVGGSKVSSLEILSFEYYRVYQNYGAVFFLSLLQLLFILLLGQFSFRSTTLQISLTQTHRFLKNRWIGIIVFFPILVLFFGVLKMLPLGIKQLIENPDLLTGLRSQIFMSVSLSVSVGIMTILLFLILSYGPLSFFKHRILMGFLSASYILWALALNTLNPEHNFYLESLSFVIGLSLILFPFLFRLSWGERLKELGGQIQSSRVLGAKPSLIFSRVVLPQIWKPTLQLSGLSAVWALGDFSFSQLIMSGRFTLSQHIYNLMNNYRLEAATTLVTVLIMLALIIFILFWGLSHVFDT